MPACPTPVHSPGSVVRVGLVVLAAGDGRRVGGAVNKVLLPLGGQPILVHSLRTGLGLPDVRAVVVVIRPEDRAEVEAILHEHLPDIHPLIVIGGSTRHGSEWNALRALQTLVDDDAIDVVAIHDAARPLASLQLFADVIEDAYDHGACLPGVPRTGLLTRSTLRPPTDAIAVQTPQAFGARLLLDAYAAADAEGFDGSDTASAVERFGGITPRWVDGEPTNLKVTFADDLARAERLVAG